MEYRYLRSIVAGCTRRMQIITCWISEGWNGLEVSGRLWCEKTFFGWHMPGRFQRSTI
ncbi:hypothetical protein FHR87_002774 [Azomonas macrocytogenes]|uniref:Uncharacterized protein n=1 Tax=Azomonas macrocytogenes TaxID=69962 RepID=A0A839T5N2_AZOMA|nr:hypothetical protein [Azomonas macrocytogenes]